MQSITVIDALRRAPLFERLTDDESRWVAKQGLEKLIRAGEVNGREGKPVESLYVIPEGEVTSSRPTAARSS